MKSIKKFKNIILEELIVTIVLIVVIIVISKYQYNNYRQIINVKTSEIISEVKDKYPNVEETEIIRILKNDNINSQKDFIKDYGYDENSTYIKMIEKNEKDSMIINCLIIATFGIIQIAIIIFYKNEQKNKINEINSYLAQLNKENYTLKINDNEEDELSKLRNELYKSTILLKEVADGNEKDKKQLSDSLADISHQLKTPLTSIRIMLDNITENPNMDEETKKEFLQDISKQIDWISSLVVSLLKISRFDAGAIKMNDKEICIDELINDIINNLSILIDIKNIDVVINIDKKLKINLDYNWQKEALTNIIKNAIEHSKENSKIYISVESSSLFLKIRIKDEGEGISKEDKKHIFERFYKSNKSTDSIGIGLALAKTIIEKDNGYIKVISNEGEGTIFEIEYIRNTLHN